MSDLTTRYIADDAPLTSFSALVPLLELKAEADAIIGGTATLPRVDWQAATLLSILGTYKLTVTQSRHTIRNASDAATGDLVCIIGDIDILVLNLNNPSKTTTIRHNATFTGLGRKIYTHDGRDVVLNEQNRTVVLFYNSAQTCYSTDARTLGSVWWSAAADATLAADTLTATQSKLKIVTEGGSVVDELATISNPNALDVITLAVKNVGYTVTVKHGVGNIWFESGVDSTLDSTDDCLVLVWDNANSRWTAPAFTHNYTISVKSLWGTTVSAARLEQLTLKNKTIPATTNMLMTNPPISRRKAFLAQARVGTTLDVHGLTFTTTGTPVSYDDSYGHRVKITSPASANSWASYISNEAPFNLRYSPSLQFRGGDNWFVPHTNHPVTFPSFFGFMTGLPTFSATFDGLGYVNGYTYTWTGVSGVFFGLTNNYPGNLRIFDNGTEVTPSSTATTASGVPYYQYRFLTFNANTNSFIYEYTSGGNVKYRTTYALSPSGALLTANLKLVAATGNYYASEALLYLSALAAEQD